MRAVEALVRRGSSVPGLRCSCARSILNLRRAAHAKTSTFGMGHRLSTFHLESDVQRIQWHKNISYIPIVLPCRLPSCYLHQSTSLSSNAGNEEPEPFSHHLHARDNRGLTEHPTRHSWKTRSQVSAVTCTWCVPCHTTSTHERSLIFGSFAQIQRYSTREKQQATCTASHARTGRPTYRGGSTAAMEAEKSMHGGSAREDGKTALLSAGGRRGEAEGRVLNACPRPVERSPGRICGDREARLFWDLLGCRCERDETTIVRFGALLPKVCVVSGRGRPANRSCSLTLWVHHSRVFLSEQASDCSATGPYSRAAADEITACRCTARACLIERCSMTPLCPRRPPHFVLRISRSEPHIGSVVP